jgi:hypothetical protein
MKLKNNTFQKGASIVKVYSDHLGIEIAPNSNAVKIEEIEMGN